MRSHQLDSTVLFSEVKAGEKVSFESNEFVFISRTSHQERERERELRARPREIVVELSCNLDTFLL